MKLGLLEAKVIVREGNDENERKLVLFYKNTCIVMFFNNSGICIAAGSNCVNRTELDELGILFKQNGHVSSFELRQFTNLYGQQIMNAEIGDVLEII